VQQVDGLRLVRYDDYRREKTKRPYKKRKTQRAKKVSCVD
jgi:hypothetical protein